MKSVIQFLREVKQEVRKVSWPTRKDTFKYTVIVVIASFLVAVYLGAVDFVVERIMEWVIT